MPEEDIPNLTLKVLQGIREELRSIRGDLQGLAERADATNSRLDQTNLRLDQTNLRLDQTNLHLDRLTEYTVDGFARVDGRLDSIVKMIGGHADLETRVRTIEDHLGLSPR